MRVKGIDTFLFFWRIFSVVYKCPRFEELTRMHPFFYSFGKYLSSSDRYLNYTYDCKYGQHDGVEGNHRVKKNYNGSVEDKIEENEKNKWQCCSLKSYFLTHATK